MIEDKQNIIIQSSEEIVSHSDDSTLYFSIKDVRFRMIKVEAGTFIMGATPEQGAHAEFAHQVTLSDYYIGQTLVTQALWDAVMGFNPSYYKEDLRPVETVSWLEIVYDFLPKLNALTGYTFTLPTEAQWEFAARGGNKSKSYRYSGSNHIDEVAWYNGNNRPFGTKLVAQKKPNELGLYDMSGNVMEWCIDRYGDNSIDVPTDPKKVDLDSNRNMRGGTYASIDSACSVFDTSNGNPDYKFHLCGFRLVLKLDKKPSMESSILSNQKHYNNSIREFVRGASFEMIKVEGGTFVMGATSEQGEGVRENETPLHQVTLSDYYIGQAPVTKELWDEVMDIMPFSFVRAKYPVNYVSWDVIVNEFLPRLNALTGKNFTLPTEAQWEFAARGGNKSHGYKYSGSNDVDSVAWYGVDLDDETNEVCQKSPNELGLYDMSGNVWEWCADYYGDYSAEPNIEPIGPFTGFGRVLRGGAFNCDACDCRVSNRIEGTICVKDSNIGFRLALSIV